jgi:hypothetical protein
MHVTSTRIDAALLEVRLGPERWREVKHAVWRGTPLETGSGGAAAELVARQELRGALVGLLAFLILSLAGVVAFVGVGDGWSIALLALGFAGALGCTVASLLLRRAVRVHEDTADHDGLSHLLDGHSPIRN